VRVRREEPHDRQWIDWLACGVRTTIGEKLRALFVSDECSDRRVPLDDWFQSGVRRRMRASEMTATPEQTAICTDHQTYELDSVELRK
jgi:hypothetical protein